MVGAEVLSPVHDAEIVFAENAVLLKMLASLQETEEGCEEAFKLPGVDLVHDGPHLRVRRDRFDRPQVLEIGSERGSFGSLLELKQRGVLKAEHGQSAHADVFKLVVYLLPVPMIGNAGEALEQRLPHPGESQMKRGPHGKTILH